MEVFSVFATLSLVDMISGPLGRITRSMNVANAATAGLGERLGNLALAMGPAAVARRTPGRGFRYGGQQGHDI